MHRDWIREREIREDIGCELRGEMACVADPDLFELGGADDEDDEPVPDTIPETQPSPSSLEADRHRMAMSMGMAVWPDPI